MPPPPPPPIVYHWNLQHTVCTCTRAVLLNFQWNPCIAIIVNVALLCIGMIKFLLSAAAISVSHVRPKLEHNGLAYDGRECSVKH